MRLAAAAAAPAAAKVLSCYLALLCLLSVCLCSGTEGEFRGSLGGSRVIGGLQRWGGGGNTVFQRSRLSCEFPKPGVGVGEHSCLCLELASE